MINQPTGTHQVAIHTLTLSLQPLFLLPPAPKCGVTSPTSQEQLGAKPLSPPTQFLQPPPPSVPSLPPISISDRSDSSQPKSQPPYTPKVRPFRHHTAPPSPLTTPPRPPGMPTLPSSRRTANKTLSPPPSAHQKPQLFHHFQTCHGNQPLMPVTSSRPQPRPVSRFGTQEQLKQ